MKNGVRFDRTSSGDLVTPTRRSSKCILAIRFWSIGEIAYRNSALINLMPEKYRLWLGGPRAGRTDDSDGSYRTQGRASGSGLSLEERVSVPEGAPRSEGSLRLAERRAVDAEPRRKERAITCPSCGQSAARGSISCAQCTEIFCDRETVANARTVLSDEMRTALRMVVKWIDRGVSSVAGTIRAAYKKYRDRAVVKGIKDKGNDGATIVYDSVAQRFHDDLDFREEMEGQGWSSETICLIDAIALLPAQDNPGRTREERAVYGDHYSVYSGDGPAQTDSTRFMHPHQYVAIEIMECF